MRILVFEYRPVFQPGDFDGIRKAYSRTSTSLMIFPTVFDSSWFPPITPI